MTVVAVTVVGCLAAVVFHALGSFAPKRVEFRLARLSRTMWVYGATGYLAAEVGGHFLGGPAAAAAAGAVGVTMGPRVSTAIRAPDEVADAPAEPATVARVTLAAAAAGAIGGMFA